MNITSIGDLARGMTLRTRATDIKTQIETLSYEMSTGRVQDVSGRLGGDYSQILDLDRSLARLDAFGIATSEAALFTDTMQLSLKTFGDSVGGMTASLLAYVRLYADANLAPQLDQAADYQIRFTPYDWTLNDQRLE